MGVQILEMGLLIWLCSFGFSFTVLNGVIVEGGEVAQGVVFIDGKAAIGETDDDFICATLDWWPPEKCDYGTCAWHHASFLNLDLSNNILLNAIKAFSPLKLRLGGTLQDKVIYESVGKPCKQFIKSSSEMFGFTQGCLPMERWDELNSFFQKSGALIIFGLNALAGRNITSDGSATGAWDPSNAESLIRYTVEKGYTIHGWELGNELCGSGVGTRVSADQYISDLITLQNMVGDIYKDIEHKPLIIAPGGFFDAGWFTEFISKTPNVLDVATHHIYNLGPGVDDHLVQKILNPSYLDGEAKTFSNLQSILQASPTKAVAWVGEAGGAYNSGRDHVTNAFVFSFWYLDQLGMAASYDTKTYCRQTLIGGNYGLLNTTTFVPNPDYYSALLWNRLMGRKVLSTTFSGAKQIRAYAHCAKQSQGITLLLINLNATTYEVTIALNGTQNHVLHRRHRTGSKRAAEVEISLHGTGSHILHHKHRTRRRKERFHHWYRNTEETLRQEYHLTAKDGNLQSQIMLLNGKALILDSTGRIPSLEPVNVNSSEPIRVAPFSIAFIHIQYNFLPACSQ